MLSWPLFSIGETQTTLGSLLVVIAVVIAAIFLGRLARKLMQRHVEKLHDSDGEVSSAYGIVPQLIVWIIGFEIALHLLGIQLTTLFAAGGFFAIGIGFAAKSIVENFLSGAILRIEKTIKPGDVVIEHQQGRWLVVESIGIRTTKARTYDGEQVLVPNSMVAQMVVENLTRSDRLYRLEARITVDRELDQEVVRDSLEKTAGGLDWRSTTENPSVYVDEIGDSSVRYGIVVWIDDIGDARQRRSDLHRAVLKTLGDVAEAELSSQISGLSPIGLMVPPSRFPPGRSVGIRTSGVVPEWLILVWRARRATYPEWPLMAVQSRSI